MKQDLIVILDLGITNNLGYVRNMELNRFMLYVPFTITEIKNHKNSPINK